MNKLEALELMQKLIGEKYKDLDESYDEAMQFRDWTTCDWVDTKREELKDLYSFLEKEYRGE